MAFCTSCGGTVNGSFCTQCGTPLSAAAQGGAASPPPPPPNVPYQAAPPVNMPYQAAPPVNVPYQAAPPAVPPPAMGPRRTSPLVWVLVIVFGLFVLGGMAVVGVGMFVVHKARQAGLDPSLMRDRPGLAISKMLAAANPDVEVLNSDDHDGTITVRDRKTGKVTTLSFDDIKKGKFRITAQDENGKTATMEFGGSASNLPSWIPTYPGSTPQVVMAGSADGGEGGTFTFSTNDPPVRVMQFYQEKFKDLGMKVNSAIISDNGGTVAGADDDRHRSLNVIVGSSSGVSGVTVAYGGK